jgi:multidrug efflux pump
MEQVSGPVVAIGLVLAAVFLPSAFITGIIGQFYRQFALTIAVSTLISAFNSLTLSPALSAILLRPRVRGKFEILPWFVFVPLLAWVGHKLGERFLLQGEHLLAQLHVAEEWWSAIILYTPILVGGLLGVLVGTVLSRPVNALAFAFFRIFNRIFDLSTAGYTRLVAGFLRVSFIVIVVYGGLLFLTWFQFKHTPTGFIPAQDKGYLVLNVQLPDAAAVGRTENRMEQIQRIALGDKAMNGKYRGETPGGAKLYPGIHGVKDTVSIAGQSILLNANAPNFGSMYVMLDRFEERTSSELSADAIARRLQDAISEEVPEAVVNVFGAPPVEGLGTSGGFKIIIQDRENSGLPALQEVADNTIDDGRKDPKLRGLFTSFRANTPWLELEIDREQAKNRGVSIDDIRTTLESSLGPYYVNDFNLFGRTWEVNVQSEDSFRRTPEQAIQRLYVMNAQRNPVPLSDFVTIKPIDGPVLIMRYNLYPSAAVNAEAGPDTSSGQAIDSLQAAAQSQLPRQMRAEWTELAYLQLQTGNTAMLAFAAAVAFVFLVLAAQYESWSLPLAVILVVPMCLLCSVTGVAMARMDINIFTQIGFLVLVGLACKNAILIVEYAKVQREAGMSRLEATLAACRLRLRPILMTSFAFILGVVPLVIAEGAGSEMRRTLGLAVFGGMLGVTIFGIFLTPVFFYVIQYFKKDPGPEPVVVGTVPPLPTEPLPAHDHNKPTGIRSGDAWPT